MTDSITSEAIASVETLTLKRTAPSILQVTSSPGYGERFFLNHAKEIQVVDVTEQMLSSAQFPLERKGIVKLTSLASFSAYVNAMKEQQTVLFASSQDRTITAIFDYHDPVNPPGIDYNASELKEFSLPQPRWGRFRAHYAFPASLQWGVWKGANKTPMTQAKFAEFIEDNILDVMPWHSMQDDKIKDLVKSLGLKLANPTDLLKVARGMALKSDENFTNIVNTDTGETQVLYAQTHTPGDASLTVPTAFIVAIPVFEGDAFYQLLVRLKYRKGDGKISWFFDVYNIDKAFLDAFETACRNVADFSGDLGTNLPLYFGSPA